MKNIVINDKSIVLEVGDNLTVKELRKIYPIITKHWDNEIEMIVQVVKALSPDKDVEGVIDSLTQEEFGELATQVWDIMNTKKK